MLLISQSEIIIVAFSKREDINIDNIRHSSIVIAQERYIAPRLGHDLYEKICNKEFADFNFDYIKPALAYYVKYMLIDDLLIQIDDRGCINFTGNETYNTTNDLGTTNDVAIQNRSALTNTLFTKSIDVTGRTTTDENASSQTDITDERTTSNAGYSSDTSDTYKAAPSALIHKMQIRTLADANTLMSKAIRYIENHEEIFGKFQGSARHFF